jgi:hypothetical protein
MKLCPIRGFERSSFAISNSNSKTPNHMKKLLLLGLIATLGSASAWAQTTSTTGTSTGSTTSSTGTTTTTPPSGGGELKQKLESMTPEQRHEFLEKHPRLRDKIHEAELNKYESLTPAQQQQFAQKHPEAAQRLSNASEAGAGKTDPGHPRVNEVNGRETNQQNRIAQGTKSGSLTPQEDVHLEKGEARLQNREANDLAKHDGHLTPSEKRGLNREENRESRHIYDDKHN